MCKCLLVLDYDWVLGQVQGQQCQGIDVQYYIQYVVVVVWYGFVYWFIEVYDFDDVQVVEVVDYGVQYVQDGQLQQVVVDGCVQYCQFGLEVQEWWDVGQ